MHKNQREVITQLKNKNYRIEQIRYSQKSHLLIEVNGKIRFPICQNPPPIKIIINQIEKDLSVKSKYLEENNWHNAIGQDTDNFFYCDDDYEGILV